MDALSEVMDINEMFFSHQMAATIDMNFQSDLMAIFEENLFWEKKQLKHNCKRKKEKDRML